MNKSLKTIYNHHHQVESFFTGTEVQFDKDGDHFYCAHGSTINKVSVDDGQVKAQITTKNEDDNVIAFTISPDNEIIIIAYQSGLIMKFNLLDDTIEREFKSIHSAPVLRMVVNQSNTLFATASSDGTVKLWNMKNHYCAHNLKGINGVISCLLFHETSDGELLFCPAGDDTIHVFDIESNQRLAKLSTHCSTITDLKVTPDGKRLISVGRDKIAVSWDISNSNKSKFGAVMRTIPIYESVESIVILEGESINRFLGLKDVGYIFATLGEEGLIKFWDTKSGSRVALQNEPPLSSDRSPSVACLQLLMRPNANQLCAVSYERNVYVYDLPKLNLVQQLQGHIDEVLSACWFADNRYLAIACNSSDLKIMELSTSNSQHLKGHKDTILSVKVSPNDPYRLITASKDCTVLIWKFDPETLAPEIAFSATGHTHAVRSIAALATEATFFSGGEDTTLKRWSYGQKKGRETTEKTTVLIAQQTVKAHDDRIDDIAVSPNDQLIATASRDKTAKIFSAANLQILATLKGHRRGVHAINFSPVDQVLVTAADVTLRMWNLQDFTCVKTFQGHDCSVLNFSFLSNGLQMISVGSDGNMKLWNCKTNECMKTIDAHSGNTWTLSLTEDDDLIVTGGQDEKLIIWKDATVEEEQKRIVDLQSQVVQEQDFMNYINKKRWRKAFKMAIKMENQTKTLNVVREILLEPKGNEELEAILNQCDMEQLNFIIECCISWNSTAKNSSIAQRTFNFITKRLDNRELLKLPSLISSMDQLKVLTEKSFNRYERLVQQATFVDFFLSSMRIQ